VVDLPKMPLNFCDEASTAPMVCEE